MDSLDQRIQKSASIIEYVSENVTGESFIDVGAHIGGFCIPLMLNSDFKKCYAFEPNPPVAEILRANADKYSLDIEVIEKALLNGVGNAVLKVPPDKESLSTLGEPYRFNEWDNVQVKVDSLDTCGIEDVDFIKIDAEGAELPIIVGGQNMIKRSHPVILFELVGENIVQFKYNPADVFRTLSHFGYWFKMVSSRDFLARTSGF